MDFTIFVIILISQIMAWPTTHTAQMSYYDGYDVLIIEVIALILMFGLNKLERQ